MHKYYDVCQNCKYLKKQSVITRFGTWSFKCLIYGISRNFDSESCDKLEVNKNVTDTTG